MSMIKYLGKFTDKGDTIDLPFDLESGKYRIEIKPVGESRRDRTVYVDSGGIMRLPNVNEKKALALGSNIFNIYKIVDGDRERVWIETYSRWSIYLQPKPIKKTKQLIAELETRIEELEKNNNKWRRTLLTGEQDGINATFGLVDNPTNGTLQVYRNGLLLDADDNEDYIYDTSDGTMTFPRPPEQTEIIEATYYIR